MLESRKINRSLTNQVCISDWEHRLIAEKEAVNNVGKLNYTDYII